MVFHGIGSNEKNYWIIGFFAFTVLGFALESYAITNDTYFESFDTREDGASIDGVDNWSVDQGSTANAITQSTLTEAGTGNALELVGSETTAHVSRLEELGNLSPSWIEFLVRPGTGRKKPDVPEGKVAAVAFNSNKIYAANGTSWEDTGETYSEDQWYRVLLKLDFSSHLYDIYIDTVEASVLEFIPVKENLEFIDSSISSLNGLGFEGAYNATGTEDNTYIDDVLVNFIKKLQIITTEQTLTTGEISSQIILQLQNDNGATQEAWKDITIQLNSESDEGEFFLTSDDSDAVSQVVIPEGNFQVEFYYKDDKEGTPLISAEEFPDRGWDDTLHQVTVIGESPSFDVSLTTPQTAGTYFDLLITAKTPEGEVDTSYNSSIIIRTSYISPDSGTMSILPDGASGFQEGVLTLNAIYPDAGTIQIEVEDIQEAKKTGVSGDALFLPDYFILDNDTTQTVSKAFSLTVTAYNAQDAVTPNYSGPANLQIAYVSPAESQEGTLSPSVLEEESFEEGITDFDVSYNQWGQIEIEAYDSVYPVKTGSSETITFQPANITMDIEAPSSSRTFFYTGESINITVTLLDEDEATITNYLGTVTFEATAGFLLQGIYQFLSTDEGAHTSTITSNSAGTYSINAQENDTQISTESQTVTVKEVTIVVVSQESPVGTTEVTILLQDEDGNIITSESDLSVSITLEEENPNGSALSSAILNPVVFHNGVSRIILTNSEAETVTITPGSIYNFKIKEGTVTFSHTTKTGIGTLMWRELKE